MMFYPIIIGLKMLLDNKLPYGEIAETQIKISRKEIEDKFDIWAKEEAQKQKGESK